MIFNSSVIARRYVSAFFALAEEQKKHENVKKDLLALQEVIAKSPELQKFLVNPVITRKQAKSAMSAVLDALKASDLTQQFFARVAGNRRLALTPLLIENYLEKLAASKGELTVQVISAAALEKGQADVLAKALAKATGKKIGMKLSENPELIGGIQVRIGSTMLDDSVSGKLVRLRQALTKAA